MLNAGNCYFVVGSGMCSPLLITPPLRLIALLTLEALFRLRTHHQPCLSLLPFLHFTSGNQVKEKQLFSIGLNVNKLDLFLVTQD